MIDYLNQIMPNITQAINQNPVFGFFLGAGGIVFGLLYGASVTSQFNNYLNVLIRNVSSNSNITDTDKTNIIQETSNVITSNYFINLNQGFINSNIITYQNIPQIQTSNIYMLNNGIINGVGTAYINVSHNHYISTTLNTDVGFPTSNAFGGIGDKIILRNGSATTCPISIGIDSNYSLWNSITSNNSNTAFDWYIDGNKKMSI